MTAIAPNSATALAFLERLPHETVNLVAIAPDGPIAGITRPKGHADLARFVGGHNGRANLYWSVNEPRPGAPDDKLGKDDIKLIRFAHVDIDPRDGFDFGVERERVLELAAEYSAHLLTPATFAIDSGGGVGLFWELDKPLPGDGAEGPNVKAVEAQNNGFAHAWLGDTKCFNVDRIMRLPGTVNLPDKRKRAKGRVAAPARLISTAGDRADMGSLAALAPPLEPMRREPKGAGDVCIDWPAVLSADGLSPDARRRFDFVLARRPDFAALHVGDTSGLKDISNSGLAFGIARRMKANGFSADEWAVYSLAHTTLGAYFAEMEAWERERTIARCWTNAEPDHMLAARTTPEEDFGPVEAEPLWRLPIWRTFRPVSFADIALDLNKRQLIKGWLPAVGTAGLIGRYSARKSQAALSMAVAISQGGEWCGRKTLGGPVLYSAREGRGSILARLEAVRRAQDLPRDLPIHVIDGPDLRDKNQVRALVLAARSMPEPPRLIVFDTLAAHMPGSEESTGEMSAAANACREISERVRTCTLIIHHFGKDEARGARGGVALTADFDAEMHIRAEGDVSAISQHKMRDLEKIHGELMLAAKSFILGMDADGDPVTAPYLEHIVGASLNFDAVDERLTQQDELALAILPADGVWMTASDHRSEFASRWRSTHATAKDDTIARYLRGSLKTLEQRGLIASEARQGVGPFERALLRKNVPSHG